MSAQQQTSPPPDDVLWRELVQVKRRLRHVVEEFEASQEEMQAANEELQSTNQELWLRYTELQKADEEHQQTIQELARLSSDVQNLIVATNIATLFVDRDICIVRFTPSLNELFNIRAVDRGRPLTDLTHRLIYDELVGDAQQVLKTLIPVKREVQDEAGRWYVVRLTPYPSVENRIGGVVITFVDITAQKETQARLRESEMRFRALVNASTYAVYRMSPDWTEMRTLDGQEFMADTSRPSTNWLKKYVHPDDQPAVLEAIEEAILTKSLFEVEHRVRRVDGSMGWTLSRAVPLLDADGEIIEWLGAASDVTERREVEEQLREAKLFAENIVETLHEPLVVLTPDLRIRLANPAFCATFAVREEEVLGCRLYELNEGHWDIAELRALLESVLPENKLFTDYKVTHDFGRLGERVLLVNGRRLDDVDLILLGIRDITEQERTHVALDVSEARAQAILDATLDAIITVDVDGRLQDINRAARRLFELTPDEARGLQLEALLASTANPELQDQYQHLLRPDLVKEVTAQRRDGGTFPAEVSVSEMRVKGRRQFAVVFRDISERRQLEREVLRITEEERQRIGRDLHDSLASQLTGVTMLARGLMRRSQANQPIDPATFEEISETVRAAADHARALARGLNPVTLEAQGLEAALRELAHDTQRLAGVTCSLVIDGRIPALQGEVAAQIYWIAQEAVTNALKHAEAHAINIELWVGQNELVLSVDDDGRGLARAEREADGRGLHIMRYRAHVIGASLSITSEPGEGTIVTCVLPLEQAPVLLETAGDR